MLELPILPPRIIPCFLISEDVFVKTKKFKNPVYIGDPINTINLFNKFEVDEIVIFDIYCSRQGKKPNFELIRDLASECWVPLSYGGGIRSVHDVAKILNSGVEKVIFERLLQTNLSELKKCIETFGASSIVVCLDIKKTLFGKYELRTLGNTRKGSISLDKALAILDKLGVGEVIVNSISHDGMRFGYDYNLLEYISRKIHCPLVALGGASCLEDFRKAINSGASAAAAGSFFVFQSHNSNSILINFPNRVEIENLFQGKAYDL